MKIDSYRFGEVVIDRKGYISDVIISPKHIQEEWWRKGGHHFVSLEDVKGLVQEKPEVLIIGTGRSQGMKIAPEARRYLEEQGIEFIAQATQEACESYNQLCQCCKVIAALHLTC